MGQSSIIVTTELLDVEAAIEIYALERGFTWRTGIYDKQAQEHLCDIKYAGRPFDERSDAVFDAEQKAAETLRAIQSERDEARDVARHARKQI